MNSPSTIIRRATVSLILCLIYLIASTIAFSGSSPNLGRHEKLLHSTTTTFPLPPLYSSSSSFSSRCHRHPTAHHFTTTTTPRSRFARQIIDTTTTVSRDATKLRHYAGRKMFVGLNMQRDPKWDADDDYDNYEDDDFEDVENDREFINDNTNNDYDPKYRTDREDAYYDDDEGDYADDDVPSSWEWETYQKTTHIYLPPPSSDITSTPKTIVHFIGGTLFGSYPVQFYSTLLETIAKKSNSIVVATSIPVTFQSNPLDHDRLCYSIAKSFRSAYRNAICDEYGTKVANTMKIVGLGHSLGSRLHCILSSDPSLLKMAYPREGNVLIAFNNFNAMSSVPGVKSLEKNVRKSKREGEERKKEETKRRQRSSSSSSRGSTREAAWGEDDDDYEDFSRRKRGRESRESRDYYSKGNGNSYNDRYNRDYYDDEDDDDDDDDDVDLQEVVTAVKDGIENRLSSIRATLTPDFKQEAFEFQPTPEELWSQIQEGEYSDNVSKNLVVQFDCDGIDQSARLARSILAANTRNSNTKDGAENSGNKPSSTNYEVTARDGDVKFARLRGTHLTPVSYVDNFGAVNMWKRISSYPMDAVLKEALGEGNRSRKRLKKKASARKDIKDLDNLVDSIAQYIIRLNS